MQFDAFCRAHGLIVDSIIPGRWVRTPTVDHPRTRNGAYKCLGDIGWVQNHATQVDVSEWRPDEDAPQFDTEAIVRKAAEFDRRMRDGWDRAARKAQQMVREATPAEHPYLQIKGFADARGLVQGEDLIIPMRHWQTNALVGAQVIRWLPEERKYEKKMLPGMRAKGAVFRIGSSQAQRTWLVEGYATGLSIEAALRMLNLRDAALVCFSAGNLIHVAKLVPGELFVFADNDESQAGEKSAISTGLRYCMSGQVGHDANDMHTKEGIFRVASLMMDAMVSVPEPVP